MSSDISKDLVSIKTQLANVIKDFSQYLSYQQQTGNTFFDISKQSKELINNWGKTSVITIRDEQIFTYVEIGVAPTLDKESSVVESSLLE